MAIDQLPHIRPICHADLEMVLAWRNHLNVRKHMLMQHEISKEEHEHWFSSLQCNASTQVFIVEASQTPIGLAQFKNIVPSTRADWGFYLAPNAPKGSGSLLGKTALDHAFYKLNLQKVCGQVLPSNSSSIQFHVKLGFQHEGIHDDLVIFGLTKHDWDLRTAMTH